MRSVRARMHTPMRSVRARMHTPMRSVRARMHARANYLAAQAQIKAIRIMRRWLYQTDLSTERGDFRVLVRELLHRHVSLTRRRRQLHLKLLREPRARVCLGLGLVRTLGCLLQRPLQPGGSGGRDEAGCACVQACACARLCMRACVRVCECMYVHA